MYNFHYNGTVTLRRDGKAVYDTASIKDWDVVGVIDNVDGGWRKKIPGHEERVRELLVFEMIWWAKTVIVGWWAKTVIVGGIHPFAPARGHFRFLGIYGVDSYEAACSNTKVETAAKILRELAPSAVYFELYENGMAYDLIPAPQWKGGFGLSPRGRGISAAIPNCRPGRESFSAAEYGKPEIVGKEVEKWNPEGGFFYTFGILDEDGKFFVLR